MPFGIYMIANVVTDTVYIGSTSVSFRERWTDHRKNLKNGKGHNRYLQNSWNKYGESAFEFDIVEEIANAEDVKEAEEFWINYYFYIGANMFNISRFPTDGTRGVKRGPPSEDWRKAHSEKMTGRKRPYTSDTARANMSIGQKKAMTEERKDYLSKINSKKEYNLVSPDGVEYAGIKGLNRFAKEHGLDYSTLYDVVNGKAFQHRGWRLLENKNKPIPPQRIAPDRGKNISLAKQKKKKMREEAM